MKAKDFSYMIGKVYGRLTVVEILPPNKSNREVIVKCSCGSTRKVQVVKLTFGLSKSCGCLARELSAQRKYKHGYSIGDTFYKLWASMKKRCYNINHPSFKDYGARGITVCNEWVNNPEAFIRWAKENGYKKGLQLDRIENDGNYEPANCRFATRKVNSNNKRNTKYLSIGGIIKPLAIWAEEKGIPYGKFYIDNKPSLQP